MKKVILLGLVLMTSISYAKRGSEGIGGGDICEDRIKIIRDDIQNWINTGGAAGLDLPQGVKLEDYRHDMLKQIKQSKVKCVSKGDRDFPVEINKTPKVCRFDSNVTSSTITCDRIKFQSMNETDQYILIHHEQAGLADIERPLEDDSSYDISNQLSLFLENVIVKKLAIKAKAPTSELNCDLTENLVQQAKLGTGNYIYNLISKDLADKGVRLAENPEALAADLAWNELTMSVTLGWITFKLASGTEMYIKVQGYLDINKVYDIDGNIKECNLAGKIDTHIDAVANKETSFVILDYEKSHTPLYGDKLFQYKPHH